MGRQLDALDRNRGFMLPVQGVPMPALDPTEALLDSSIGRVVEAHAGDLCSALGILGAATLLVNHRGPSAAGIEQLGMRIVTGSMAAGGLDTAIQARNVIKDDGAGAEQRGNGRSSWGSVAYAATGLLPAASVRAIRGFHKHPTAREIVGLSALGVNGAVLGYELMARVPKIVQGEENASGYGSLAASMGGFVVARRFALRH